MQRSGDGGPPRGAPENRPPAPLAAPAAIGPSRLAGGAALHEHPRHLVLAALVAGLLLGPRVPLVAVVLVAGLVALGLASAALRDVVVGLVVVALLGGAAGAGARTRALERTALTPLMGHVVRGDVTIVQAPRASAFGGWSARARYRGEPILLRAGTGRRPPVGAILAVRAAVKPPDEYAAAIHAHAILRADEARDSGRRRGGLAGRVDRLRERGLATLGRVGGPARGALLQGMVLGQDAELPTDVRDEARAAGLSHLTAASGANITLLATFVLAAAALTGVPFHTRWLVVLGLIAVYVPLAGGGPSIQRAGIMGAAGVVAVLAGRPADRWYALGLAAAVTLGLDPRAAADPGWQLSFVAVVALATLARPWSERLARRGVPAPLAEALAVTGAATLATAPVLAAHFGTVAPLSLPANLLVAPVVAPIMWLGFSAVVGNLVAAAAMALGGGVPMLGGALVALGTAVAALADVLVALTGPLLGWVLAVAHRAGGGAQLHPPAATATTSVPVAAALFAAGRRAPPRVRLGGRRVSLAVPAAVVAVTLALAVVALRPRAHPPPPVADLRITFLDVGQGDATLVEVPGHAVLVDAGPPEGVVVAGLRAAGVARLDALVVTHAQADHEGGAAAVLGALPVGLVLDGRDGVRSPLGERFAAVAARRHVRTTPVRAGQRLRLGTLVLDVLSPADGPTSGESGADPNQRAIVLEAHAGGGTALLTADAESDVLAGLDLGPVDVLKVSHHGSADDGLPALLARLRPIVAGIEVGAHNTYGHPAPSTLAALRAVVPRTVRTDVDGTVRADLDHGRWTVTRAGG